MDSHQQQKGISLIRAEGDAIYMCEHNTDIKKSFLTCAFKNPVCIFSYRSYDLTSFKLLIGLFLLLVGFKFK